MPFACADMDQMPAVFAWNSFVFVFMLTMLALLVGVGYGTSETTLNALLVLLLTMAATKTAVMSWVPLTGVLTTMDKHVLSAFALTALLAAFVSFDHLCGRQAAWRPAESQVDPNFDEFDLWAWYDRIVFATVAMLWLITHGYFFMKIMLGSWKVPWTEVVAREDAQTRAWCEKIEEFGGRDTAYVDPVVRQRTPRPPPEWMRVGERAKDTRDGHQGDNEGDGSDGLARLQAAGPGTRTAGKSKHHGRAAVPCANMAAAPQGTPSVHNAADQQRRRAAAPVLPPLAEQSSAAAKPMQTVISL